MGHFFARIGVAISGTRAPEPITSERLQHFLKVSNEFGYWNGSPADNAAVGLNVPLPTT
jgi:hypothetical protein